VRAANGANIHLFSAVSVGSWVVSFEGMKMICGAEFEAICMQHFT
jgi:hypothetical protein